MNENFKVNVGILTTQTYYFAKHDWYLIAPKVDNACKFFLNFFLGHSYSKTGLSHDIFHQKKIIISEYALKYEFPVTPNYSERCSISLFYDGILCS